jgi:hypothetical protein
MYITAFFFAGYQEEQLISWQQPMGIQNKYKYKLRGMKTYNQGLLVLHWHISTNHTLLWVLHVTPLLFKNTCFSYILYMAAIPKHMPIFL